MTSSAYPVRVDAALDGHVSRWLWLVKWFLAIPHYIVLTFLWLAFIAISFVAFIAILITGRYPRAIFDFNVGVLRWTWRVSYYAYGALGTDQYPPFTLQDVADYPAHLEIEYPERLSRGLVLVKWWLLAIPHYIVVALFAGGGTAAVWRAGTGGGLIGILVLVAAVVLLVTGSYPRAIFDFVLGMDRWVLRVAAYAALMTDEYPPFRLDQGGSEPGGTIAVGRRGGPGSGTAASGDQADGPGVGQRPGAAPAAGGGWTVGGTISGVAGAILVPAAVSVMLGGAGLVWAVRTHTHAGYLTSSAATYSTSGYALATSMARLGETSWDQLGPAAGRLRIRITATDPGRPVFVGIAPAAAATRYLAGVRYTTLTRLADDRGGPADHIGAARPTAPTSAGIWAASAAGAGTQAVTWAPRPGRWMVVAMNRDATAGLSLRADAGVRHPALPWLALALILGGIAGTGTGIALIVVPIRRGPAHPAIPPSGTSAPSPHIPAGA